MHVTRLSLADFRCYEHLDLTLPSGVTVIEGANAQGKTSLLEAVAWLATGRSFRGVPDAVLVRTGMPTAIARAEIADGARAHRIETEIHAVGRNRLLVNGSRVASARELGTALQVTVFAPDDLELVKGGPAGRRDFLDELLVAMPPRQHAVQADYQRVLRHRNALLRSGARDPDAARTLDVFNEQLATAGAELASARVRLVERLVPEVRRAYGDLVTGHADPKGIDAEYEADWIGDATTRDAMAVSLRDALTQRRQAERERGVTLAGPHRDEWHLRVGDLESRTHASQGEQRTLALALRLGGHRLRRDDSGTAPVLLLDDVFSELDDGRANALVASLDSGQTLVTTASDVPVAVQPDRRLRIDHAHVVETVT